MPDHSRTGWFEDLLQRHHARLVAFVWGLLNDPQQARDVVQDVFVDAWCATEQHAPPFTGDIDPGAVRRWLYRVAYNRAISHARHRRVLAFESLDTLCALESEAFYEPNTLEDQVAENEALRAALSALPSQDAACVLLNVVHGFTAWELAQIIGVSSAAAKKRLWRAKERLRAAYLAQEQPTGKRTAP